MFPIERPSRSVMRQTVPPRAAMTITSTSNPRGECAIVAIAAVSHGARKPGQFSDSFAAEPLQLIRGELARPHGLQGARRTPGMIGEYRLGRLGPFAARRWKWRLQRHSSGGATTFLLSRDFMPVMVNQPIPHDGREANKKPRPIAGRGCVGLGHQASLYALLL
jgi:hypothetical protein